MGMTLSRAKGGKERLANARTLAAAVFQQEQRNLAIAGKVRAVDDGSPQPLSTQVADPWLTRAFPSARGGARILVFE